MNKIVMFILALLLILAQSKLSLADCSIIVVDNDDEKIGIVSEIYKVEREISNGQRKDKETYIGKTSEKGTYVFSGVSEEGKLISIRPISRLYFYKVLDWPKIKEQKIKISKIVYVKKLERTARRFEESNDYTKAALAYNEINARTPEASEDVKKKIYMLWGKHLDNTKPIIYDEDQATYVMSPGLKKDIINFQKTESIKATGNLDYKTLQQGAGDNIGSYMFEK